MGSSSSLAKTILIPASISLTLYLFLSFLLLPFIRRYHARYAHYLPLHAISAHTSSLRDRIGDALMRLMLRSRWRRNTDTHADADADADADGGRGHSHDTISIGDEEGENMVGMHMDPERRRALERRWNSGAQHRAGVEAEGRLSRDLEEGFMDDSDEEEEHAQHR